MILLNFLVFWQISANFLSAGQVSAFKKMKYPPISKKIIAMINR